MYTIINKIESIDSNLTYTPVGYTVDQDIVDTINNEYDSTLKNWIEINKADLENDILSISEFFNLTPKVHIARTSVSLIDDLIEITDLNDL